jgi:hypothetical protein
MSNQRLQSSKNRDVSRIQRTYPGHQRTTLPKPKDDSNTNINTSNRNQSSPNTRRYDVAFNPKSPPGLRIDLTYSSDSKDAQSAKKQKQHISKMSSAKSVRYTADNFVDLTLPPPPPSFEDIKKAYPLFYSYNPNGC